MYFDELDVKDRVKDVLNDTFLFNHDILEKISLSVCGEVYDEICNRGFFPEGHELSEVDDSIFYDCMAIPVQEYIASHFVIDKD